MKVIKLNDLIKVQLWWRPEANSFVVCRHIEPNVVEMMTESDWRLSMVSTAFFLKYKIGKWELVDEWLERNIDKAM